MRAIQFKSFGGPEVLELVEVPEPHVTAKQIRVVVNAVGVNPVDWKFRQGMMGGELPEGTGLEVAGVVDEVGDEITDVAAGDAVFGRPRPPSGRRGPDRLLVSSTDPGATRRAGRRNVAPPLYPTRTPIFAR